MKIKKAIKSALLLGMALSLAAIMTACGGETQTNGKGQAQSVKKFTICYLPNESTEQNADARAGLARDLSAALGGIEVSEFAASDYNAVIEAMRTGKADMAYMSALTYAMASERTSVELVGMKAKDGTKENATYKSLLVVKADSPINAVTDIKGKSMAFVDPDSTSGNLVPAYEIMKAFPNDNLDMDTLHTNGAFFSTVMFSGKHQAGLQAVVKGDVDIAAVSDSYIPTEIANGNVKEGSFKIIHYSAPIPAEPMVIRGNMPTEIKDKVKELILGYKNTEFFEKVCGGKDARFIPCSDADYKDIVDLHKKLNAD